MWSGTSALKNIDQSLQTIRNESVRLDSQLSQLTETLAANQRHRLKLINDIALIRLTEIETGELLESLSAADHQAVQILQQRNKALSNLNQQIERNNQATHDAEVQREELLGEVNAASQKIVDIETQIQSNLKRDDAYLAQFANASEAQSIADEAEQKVNQAQLDMTEKAKPYQADSLFLYLWQRNFGTTEYNGGLFSRFMDGWVARIIKYEDARINYWNLTEIPKRLQEHADGVSKIADEEHMALQQIEFDALEQGGAPILEGELNVLRERLDKLDDQIEEIENALNQKLDERARYVAGEDEYIKRSVERLTKAMQHQDLNAIHRYVRATTSPTDDKLVIELQKLDDALDDVEEDLVDVRTLHDNKISRLKELEQVRRQFKNSRFDDVRSGFGNQSLLVGILGQFLQGVVSGSDLWRVIQRNQRYQDVGSMPDFGSDGLGSLGDLLGGGRIGRQPRKRRQSTWHWPKPRGGGGGFKAPRRSSRGGFKTGGGF